MKGLQLVAPHDLRVVDLREPRADGRAIVEVDRVGICGTDLQIYAGRIPVDYPRVLGHEIVGRVVAPGDRGLVAVGTRVLVDPATSCGRCAACLANRPTVCPSGTLLGRDIDGGLAERVAVDELQLLPIPAGLDRAAEPLLQVLGTCMHAQDGLPARAGTALVVGLGVSGMIHLQLLRRRGIDVIGVGRSVGKRALASELGALATCEPAECEATVRSITDGVGASLVVEAVGTVATLAQAIHAAAPGAAVLCFGTITGLDPGESFPWYELYHKEITIVNPRAAMLRNYADGIALAAGGGVSLAPLLSRTVSLADAPSAFRPHETAAGGLKTAVRILD
jgi:L-iditol 2-dehydrogenase